MKIYEMIKELNKKVSVKEKRVMEVKKHYLSLYRANMVYLYDEGYISDPTSFNEKEILGNIVDLNIQRDLAGVTGRIGLTEDYIGFALAKNKDDEDKSYFLSKLLGVVKYRNISRNIDKFYDDNGFAYDSNKKISLGIVQSSSRITNKNGFDIDEGILKCFETYGMGNKFISLNETIYKIALETLGIEDVHKESLFVSGLTREEEIEYSEIILNGLVNLDGPMSDKLVAWLNNNKWAEGNKFSSQNEGLYNWIVYIKSNRMIEEQSLLMNKIIDDGYKIVCMKSNGFYIVDDESPVLYPVGIFVVCGDDDRILPDINIIEGYTGEVYSIDYLNENELGYVGCPIELYSEGKSKGLFIDKEQTELSNTDSWFKENDVDITFCKPFYREGVFTEDSIEDRLYKILSDANEGKLIGLLKNEDKGTNLVSVKKAVVKKL